MRRAPQGVDISVLVPVSERPEPLDELYAETVRALKAAGYSSEFVFAIEPWGEGLAQSLAAYQTDETSVRVLRSGARQGATGLARQALAHCSAPIVLVLPGYGRIDESAIPELIEAVVKGADLAVARRWPRRDPLVNRLQTRLLHGLLARTTSTQLHDVASGVWAGRVEVLEQVPLYGDFFRFLPLLAAHEGFRVVEVDCPQHPRDLKTRLYRPTLYLRRLLDILALIFLTRFTQKPLRFFGLIGSATAVAGVVVLGIAAVQRLAGQPLANRPFLLLGVLLMTLGVQAVALGLVGEIIVHLHESTGRRYRLVEVEPTSDGPAAD